MKKKFYMTLYKPGYNLPFITDSYDRALEYFNTDKQILVEISVDVPDIDIEVEGKIIDKHG